MPNSSNRQPFLTKGDDGPPPRINCEADYRRNLDLEPVGAGPLALAAVYCQGVPPTLLPRSPPVVSPDARSIVYCEDAKTLRVARLDGGRILTDYQIELGIFAHFGGFSEGQAFAWASDSQFLWTAKKERLQVSGTEYAKSAMGPARTGIDGHLDLLPPLAHPAGSLDALLWAGGNGLAIAQFGARGASYRPKHDDRNPTFAIVDAAAGRVLDTLPFEAVAPLREHIRNGTRQFGPVWQADATTLEDGRVRMLVRAGHEIEWLVWTQGEPPRTTPDPYATELLLRMVISPDGSRVLVGRPLRTDGWIHIRGRGTTPGRPVEGVLAALHDVDTGRALWTIRATAVSEFQFPIPAISRDGRYALVGLMPRADQGLGLFGGRQGLIALVNMNDGETVQTLPAPGVAYAMGFVCGGRTVWTHAGGMTALYDVRDNAQ